MAVTILLSPSLVSTGAFWFHLPVNWVLVLVAAAAAAGFQLTNPWIADYLSVRAHAENGSQAVSLVGQIQV